ncbi:hypothetical protein [uncultured Aquimarina sp.]|uniref:hypothetical protein n=1 Tax=uncultured Aquimarina sp. TaxID=575652 RepID=UPI00260FC4C5|nr:hypothetical protein [uncultured Aquimarina sp.]
MKSIMKNGLLYYKIWLQIVLYIGILFFICLTIALSYWIVIIIMSEGFLGTAGVFVLLYFAGQMSYTSLILSKYITTNVVHNEQGFKIASRKKTIEYTWSDISKANRYTLGGVLRLYDHQGKSIYTVQSFAFGYRFFRKMVNEKIGIRTVLT